MSSTDLITDAATLGAMLPPDITAIAGVTRSGMLPATLIAMQRHLPLFEINPSTGLVALAHGWRLDQPQVKRHKLAVIDDTVASGVAMRTLREKVLDSMKARYVTGAVYASDESIDLVDYAAVRLPLPHYLEWNLFNSIHSRTMAVDFDGILCDDCPADCDDDGPRYLEWMRTVRPLYLPRRSPVKLIVTARLEKYRSLTVAWLTRHGVQCKRLVMGPWPTLAARRARYDAGRFKGVEFSRSSCNLFIESCPTQAAAIATASNKRVICPGAGRIWN